MLIQAERLCVDTRLKDVSLTLEAGQIVTLVGPNGAGKTTLVKVLLGLIEPTEGVLRKKPGLTLGYMPQKLTLNPLMPLRVRDFLALVGVNTLPEDWLGITHLYDRSLQALSGGEMQRVLLAQALLTKPDLLVLDEPAQGMDVVAQDRLYHHIQRARDELKCGILLVSHDLHLVLSASDHVICLNHHVCCSGHPDAVRRDAAYLRLFPSQTLAPYTHHHDHVHS